MTDVADVDDNTLEITWNEPSDLTEVSQYNLYREDSPGAGFFQVNVFPVGTTLVEDTGLNPATVYSYYLTSDGIAGESIPSNIIQGTTTGTPLPDPPTLDSLTQISSNEVELLFTEPINVSQISGYMIYRDDNGAGFVVIDMAPVGSGFYNDISVIEGETYTYRITSRTLTDESLPSNELSITLTISSIDPPTLDDVATIDEQSLEIMWTEPSDTTNIFGYNLYREDSAGAGFVFINSFTVGENFATDIGLQPSTTYSYYLTSQGISGESIPSNIIAGSTSSATYVSPVIQGATLIDTTSIELFWFEPTDTTNIFEYVIYRDAGSGFSEYDRTPVGTNTYIDSLLTPSTTYSYYIRSDGLSGQALPSNTVVVTTGSGVVNPPTITDVNPFDEFTMEVIWVESSDISEIFEYRITRSGDNSTFFDVGFEPVGSTSFFDFGLMPNTFYMYQIYSVGVSGESVGSNIIAGITQSTLFAQAPHLIDIFTDGANTISLFWDEPTNTVGITSYQIERRIQGQGSFETVNSVSVGTTTYSELVSSSTIFEYRIKSVNTNGAGLPSNIFSMTSSVDPAQVNSVGVTIEPNPTNTFPKISSEMFTQTTERFRLSPDVIDLIITDIDVNKLNAYQIITKMNDGSYSSSQQMINAGAFYGSNYILLNNVTKFLETLPQKVIDATGGSMGSGNNPNFGVRISAE